jgi:dihydrofolate reductase
LTFTFVTEGIESAIRQAQAAAGDKDVTVVGGASTFQQCLKAGLVDELQLDIMPVLLCKGLRLFEHLEDLQPLELEKVKVVESSMRTYLGFHMAVK